jgi:prepilin-type N-terminal cleavage/methylation domain-containing protein
MNLRSASRRLRRGYTLIELSIVMMVGLGIASILMILVNQQFAFLKIYRAQNFLAEEAPIINNQLARIIGQADRFSIHNNIADAQAGTNAVMAGGTAVLLYFRQPDGTMLKGIVSYQNLAGMGQGLYYYNIPASGVAVAPDWAITRRPTAVAFSIDQGILRTTLTGPAGERIIYSGTMQQ